MGIKLTKRKILFITIPILILVVICCIIIILIGLLFGLSALPNFQENPISTNSSATVTPEFQFMQVSPAARRNNNIIIHSIVPDTQFGITEVQLVLAPSLIKADIFANGERIKANIGDNRIMKVVFQTDSAPKSVIFTFKSNDKLLATCTLNGNKILDPEGDCSW